MRKGGRDRQDAVAVAVVTRTAVLDGGGLCVGARAGYAIALPWITLTPSLAACREHLANTFVATTLTEVSASLSAAHVWDAGRLGFSVGGRLGGGVLHERFMTTGIAPARSDGTLTLALIGGASLQLIPGIELTLDTGLANYLFRQADVRGAVHWATPVALGGDLGIAYAW